MSLYVEKIEKNITEANLENLLSESLVAIKEFIEVQAIDTERIGIYLSTSSAGKRESIAFWKEALVKTPSFVNPANFPWTLPNAPAARIAYFLNITGPVYTFLGNDFEDAIPWKSAWIDFKNERVSQALVVNLETQQDVFFMSLTLYDEQSLKEYLNA